MTTKYRPAPEIQEIAEDLIDEHHRHLIGVRIDYLFRDKAATNKGRTVLGTATLVTGRAAFLARQAGLNLHGDTGEIVHVTLDADKPVEPAPFFVLDIALDAWGSDIDGERWGLTDAQRIALVDHELAHCGVDGDTGKLKLLPHDLEEFVAIVKRRGLWKTDIVRFAEAAAGVRRLPGLDGTYGGSA